MASFYLDGAALSWYQWIFRNGFITSWSGFLQALESRFVPSYYDDPKGALFKLTQRGMVNEYLTEFKRLANRVIGLPPPFLLSCFVSGLAQDIRREVLALQPISLPQAMALAKLRDRRQAPLRPHNTHLRHIFPLTGSHNPPMSKGHQTRWPSGGRRASITTATKNGALPIAARDACPCLSPTTLLLYQMNLSLTFPQHHHQNKNQQLL